jgi:DNA polymerase iota
MRKKKTPRLTPLDGRPDVTDMIDAHLTELGWGGDNGATVVLEKKQTFHAKPKQQEMFTYNPYTWVGFKVDKEGDRMSQSTESQERLSWDTVKLHAASHLALYIRSQIKDRLGFTCSAGIASSKLFAKLAADAHKPNEQTLLCPDMYNDFILPLEIRKIMGVGHKAAHTICEKLGFIKDAQQSLITEEEEDNNVASLDVTEHPAQMAEDWHLPQLTVSYVQKNCTIKQFVDWFGDRQGQQLWDLVHGKDRTAVVPTPLIPTQISIEDSFRRCSTLQEAITKLHELSISFIKRLEVELRTENEWLKYPTTLRLTTRNRSSKNSRAWRDTRISKSKRMPVDVFDIESSVEERASALVEQSLSPMLKNLVKEPFDLTL